MPSTDTRIARPKINDDSDSNSAASSYDIIYFRSLNEHVAAHMLVLPRFLSEQILRNCSLKNLKTKKQKRTKSTTA